MKKPLLPIIILSIVLSACSLGKLQNWQSSYQILGFDFTEYASKGFMFTPEGYIDKYESMGLVEVVFIPEVIRHSQAQPLANIDGYYILYTADSGYYVKEADTDQIIAEMYNTALKMGADAVIRFNIQPYRLDNNGTEINTVRANGFAIKRVQ